MVDRVIRVVVDPSGALIGSKQVNRALETTGQKVRSTRAGFSGLAGELRLFASALALNEIRQFGDTAILLENRLKLVTDSGAELNVVMDELFGLSQETRTSFEGSVELFARVARSTKQLGISQQEILTVTRAVNQAVQISGATAQEASNAIIQFSQGLASGALRGEELRSVLEQVPRLAIALADGLNLNAEALAKIENADPEDRINVTIGTLRELGAQGKLTTEQIIEALGRIAPELQAEFAQLAKTSDGALVQIRNSFLRLVDELDDELDITGNLFIAPLDFIRGIIDGVTERVPDISDAFKVLSASSTSFLDDAERGIDSFFDNFNDQIGISDETAITFQNNLRKEWPNTFRQLELAAEDPISFVIDAFASLPSNIASSLRILTVEAAAGFKRLELTLVQALLATTPLAQNIQSIRALLGGETDIELLTRLQEELEFSEAALEQFRTNEANRIKESAENSKRIREQARKDREEDLAAELIARDALDARKPKTTKGGNVNADAEKDADKLLEKLKKQTEELRIQNEFGLVAEQIQRQNLVLAVEEEGASAKTVLELKKVTSELALQEEIRDRIKAETEDADAIHKAELKLQLLKAEGDERFRILAIQQLSIGAEEKSIARLTELLKLIEAQEDAQKSQLISLEEIDRQFAEGVGEAVGDFLDNIDEGFDGIKESFADLLSSLAQEIIKNIIVTQFFESFGQQGGGLFSRFFSTASKAGEGRGVGRNEPIVVGDKGQAEIFVPTQQGTVVPITAGSGAAPNVIVLNEQDPNALISALRTREGATVQRNFVHTDQRLIRRTLNIR